MSVTVIIGEGDQERRFDVAPYRLKELRAIAPFVEEMNAVAKRIDAAQKEAKAAKTPYVPNLPDLFALSRSLCEIVAVGVRKVDPTFSADVIEEMVGLPSLASLQEATKLLLEQSGLSAKGEGTAPSRSATRTGPEQAEASPTRSEELSAS